jgi:hypothetical protein
MFHVKRKRHENPHQLESLLPLMDCIHPSGDRSSALRVRDAEQYSAKLEAAPLPVLIVAAVPQAVVMFAIAIFGGMFFASRVGLGAPILDAATRGVLHVLLAL